MEFADIQNRHGLSNEFEFQSARFSTYESYLIAFEG